MVENNSETRHLLRVPQWLIVFSMILGWLSLAIAIYFVRDLDKPTTVVNGEKVEIDKIIEGVKLKSITEYKTIYEQNLSRKDTIESWKKSILKKDSTISAQRLLIIKLEDEKKDLNGRIKRCNC